MCGKLKIPVRVLLRCGAYGFITRYDSECLYPFVVELSYLAAIDYGLASRVFTVDENGAYMQCEDMQGLDVTHYYVGKAKFPFDVGFPVSLCLGELYA